MRVPSASELMHVWERGLTQPPIERALAILQFACPDMSRDDIAALSIGERDSRLLTLRRWLFGEKITSASSCPHCQQLMEWTTDVSQLQVQPDPDAVTQRNHHFSHQDYRIEFRLPNTLDMFAIEQARDVDSARQTLLKRCVHTTERKGKTLSLSRIPQSIIQKVLKKMEQCDPQADLRVELLCANCQHKWETAFDIISFLWSEIQNWAKQTLRSVHLLARAYGWREQDILAMSPLRRQLYIEMAGY